MKLRNLLCATMVACAFASCSNDDGIDGNGGKTPEGATAQLEVKISTPSLTKAVGESATIASLGVLVFDASTNKLEAKGIDVAGKAGEGKSVVADNLTAGQKKVLVLANMKSKMDTYTTATTLDNVLADTQDFSNAEVDGSLSMNSQVYTVDLKAGVINYLGYGDTNPSNDSENNYLTQAGTQPVKLYRNVARIVLESVQVTANQTKYPGAKLTVNRVFVLHGNKTTKVATEKPWGTTMPEVMNYLNGCTNTDYAAWVAFMAGKTQIQAYLTGSNYENVPAYSNTITNQSLTYDQKWQPADQSFYVYENTSTALHTLLVVEGKLEYGEVTGDKAELRYYSVAIGKDGITGIDATTGVYPVPAGFDGNRDGGLTGTVRNIQYNVNLKVAGPGYTTPFGPDAKDETKLDVQVEVVNFGAVNQDVTIE